MTQEQKDSLIVKMLSTPELLTLEETDAILSDEYLCQIYSTAAMLKAASRPQKIYDADEEWAAFRHRIRPKPLSSRWYMRVAAIFLAVIVGANLIGFFIDRLLTSGNASSADNMANDSSALVSDQHNIAQPITQSIPIAIQDTTQSPAIMREPGPENIKPETPWQNGYTEMFSSTVDNSIVPNQEPTQHPHQSNEQELPNRVIQYGQPGHTLVSFDTREHTPDIYIDQSLIGFTDDVWSLQPVITPTLSWFSLFITYVSGIYTYHYDEYLCEAIATRIYELCAHIDECNVDSQERGIAIEMLNSSLTDFQYPAVASLLTQSRDTLQK